MGRGGQSKGGHGVGMNIRGDIIRIMQQNNNKIEERKEINVDV